MALLTIAILLLGAACASSEGASEGPQGDTAPARRASNIITADEIASRPGALSLEDLLVGRVPGVELGQSGLVIRGRNTLRGSSTPLYVLDGMPLMFQPTLSIRDIERVEVVKGPAAARYGLRGANGVILIETRSGR